MPVPLHRRWMKLFSRSTAVTSPLRPALRLHLESLEDRTLLSTSIPLSPSSWATIGPSSLNGGELFSGRIAAVAADPTNANVLYVGAAGGGVWKTTNAGASWTPLTDDQATLVIGAIAVAPSNPQVLYVGTGEANMGPSKAIISRFNIYYGEGVLHSTDGGASWTLEGNDIFHRRSISRIVVSPRDPNTVYVAVGYPSVNGLPGNTGIWKSTDGGGTWTDTTSSISTTAAFSDVAIDPANGNTLYAAVGDPNGDPANGIWKTNNAGATWTRAGNFPTGADPTVGRVMVALAPSSPNVLYGSIAMSGPNASLYKMMKSTDGGQNWVQLVNTPDYMTSGTVNGVALGFGDYDTSLAVDPSNPNIAYAGGTINGGLDFIQTTDGGANWQDITFGFNGVYLHGDEHAIAFDAQGRLIEGNDGGIWRLENNIPSQIAWTDLNSNLDTIQFEGIAQSHASPNTALGGSQDNGTEIFNDNLVWLETDGGDGGKNAIDFTNPQVMYHDAAVASFGSDFFVEKSTDGGHNWFPITAGLASITSPQTVFYPPMVMDPANPQRLFLGATSVYETTNGGGLWTPISTPLTNGWTVNVPIEAIAAAKSDQNTIYATAGGHLFVTFNGGGLWKQIDIPGFSDDFLGLTVDPTNNLTAYAVRDRFTDGPGGHVFRTTDGGAHWADISGDLPDTPTNTVVFDPRTQLIYIGTDIGVYASADGGNHWQVFGTGLPNARAVQLDLSPEQNILAVGTYGRGMWEIIVPTLPPDSGVLEFSTSTFSVSEHAATATITINRVGGSTGEVSVGYQTTDGTARAGVDYQPASGTLTFAPGQTRQSFTINLIDDGVGESDKTVQLSLTPIGGASLGFPSTARLVIQETDFGQLQFSAASYTVNEDAGTASIQVTRTGGSDGTVAVHYTTSDGTAKVGTDYTATSGTLIFGPGQTSAFLTVPILDDGGSGETDETVNLSLDSPGGGAALGTANAVLTILESHPFTPVSLIRDIDPGASGSNPSDLVNVNGTIFFVADDGVHGRELWATDGTGPGTHLVLDIVPGSIGSNPTDLVNVAGTLFFAAEGGLWRSDGTAGGTSLVRGSLIPEQLTAVGSRVFFTGNGGLQLWESDGSGVGTTLLTTFVGGPSWLTNVDGTLFFSADDGATGRELWRSDGTPAGTVLVANINPELFFPPLPSDPADLINVGGRLYFTADDGSHGRQLWKSDGSADTTAMVRDISGLDSNGQPFNADPHGLTAVGGEVFFVATDPVHGDELWKSDGTAGGTVLVADLNPGPSGSGPTGLTNVNGTLFFAATAGAVGDELWKSDGTAAGTVVVKDINTTGNSSPADLVNVNRLVYFTADDGVHGRELWESDGTGAGTTMLADINPGPDSSNPAGLAIANGTIFFKADDGSTGAELWRANNAPPAVSVPGAQQVQAGGTVSFSAASGTAITIRDPDLAGGFLTVTLTASGGRISLAHTDGITIMAGTGHGDQTLTFVGSLAAVNAALDGLSFTLTSPTGTGSLSISANDQGNTGFGGPQTGSASIVISVAPPPGNGGGGGSGGPPTVLLTNATIVTAGRGATEAVYALTSDHSLYRWEAALGWMRLGVGIASISAATEASGNPVLFAVTQDQALARFSDLSGWTLLGARGTVASASAGTDSAGLADVFVLTVMGDFLEFRGSSGWQNSPVGGRGTILSAAAGDHDRVVVVTANRAVAEFDPHFGWLLLTGPGQARSVSVMADPQGRLEVFLVTQAGGLLWYDGSNGWRQIGSNGSIQSVSTGTDRGGQPIAWVITTRRDLVGFDTATGWRALQVSGVPVGLAAGAADRVFIGLADGSVDGHDDAVGFFPLAGAGFLAI